MNTSTQIGSSSSGLYPVNISLTFQCEPYVVLSTAISPLFDEKFRWYGADKQHFIALLGALHYQFLVLSEEFIVHVGHPAATWSKRTEPLLNKIRKVMFISAKEIVQIEKEMSKLEEPS